ncbi:MAG: Gldg family protein [Mariprofundaceae bacterium]
MSKHDEQQDYRKNVRRQSWLKLLSMIVVTLLLLLATTLSHVRSDWTEGQVYTLSESTVLLLDQLEEPVLVRAYITSGLPQPYGRLERFLQDILYSYHEAGGGNVGFEVVDPATVPNISAALAAMNIPKIQVQVVEDDQAKVMQGYLAVVIEYLDSKEIIPVVQSELGFEYLLTRKIKKLTGKGRMKVGISTSFGASALHQLRQLQEFASDDYELVEVDLESGKGVIPSDLKTLIIAGMERAPTQAFRDQLNEFRKRGGGLLLLVGNAKPQLSVGFQVVAVAPDANDWIRDDFGIAVEPGLVMDRRSTRVGVNQRQDGFMFRTLVDYPFLPSVTELDSKHVVTAGLKSVSIPFASPLLWLGDDHAANSKESSHYLLMRSSELSGVQSGPPFDVDPLVAVDARFSGMTLRPSLLGIAIDDGAAESSRVIVMGSPSFLDDEFMDGANLITVLNMVDWLSGDEALITLRSRGVTQRPLEELSSAGRTFFKGLWIFGLPMLISLIGLWRWWALKRRRALLAS